MRKAELFRRAFHLTSPIWLSYYLLPPDSYIGVRPELIVVAILAVVFVVEAVRIGFKIEVPGLREYEGTRPAAYALGGLGIGIGLLLFPVQITAVAVCGMAWIDPLCALTKKGRCYPIVPLAVYFAMAVGILLFFGRYSLLVTLAMAALGAVVAVASERPNLKTVDDDLIMVVVPLFVLGAFDLAL